MAALRPVLAASTLYSPAAPSPSLPEVKAILALEMWRPANDTAGSQQSPGSSATLSFSLSPALQQQAGQTASHCPQAEHLLATCPSQYSQGKVKSPSGQTSVAQPSSSHAGPDLQMLPSSKQHKGYCFLPLTWWPEFQRQTLPPPKRRCPAEGRPPASALYPVRRQGPVGVRDRQPAGGRRGHS